MVKGSIALLFDTVCSISYTTQLAKKRGWRRYCDGRKGHLLVRIIAFINFLALTPSAAGLRIESRVRSRRTFRQGRYLATQRTRHTSLSEPSPPPRIWAYTSLDEANDSFGMPKRPPSVQSGTSNPDRLEPKLLRAVEANNVADVKDIIDQAQSRGQCSDTFLAIGLIRACDKDLPDVARFLLSQGANPDYASGNKPPSILRAAEYGHVDIAEALIDHHANLEVCDKKGRTALMTAAYKGQFKVVQLLLTHGADIDTCDHRKRNVLHNLAADKGDEKNAKPGKKPRRKCTVEIIQYILQAGVNVEAEDGLGRTPLHWTCVTDHEDLMRILLTPRTRGGSPRAVIDARDNRRKTPLHLAAGHNFTHLVNILLDNKADVHARSDGDWTALHTACTNGSVELVNILVNAEADINSELLNGRTPLHIAAEAGNSAAAECLLKQPHCKRAIKDRFGNTPLLMAAQHGKKDIAEMLAPWNHLDDLSRDEIEASRRFNATIVDFGNFRNENRVQRNCSVYELLYARDPKDASKHAISTLPKNSKSTDFRWIHLPVNNIAWCDALLTKRFLEEGATDVEGYKALETSFNHQHRGQQHHSRFMRPMCQVVQRSAIKDEATLLEKSGPPRIFVEEPHLLTAVPETMNEALIANGTPHDREPQAISGAESSDQSKPRRSKKREPKKQDTVGSEASIPGKPNGKSGKSQIQRVETNSTLAASDSSSKPNGRPSTPKSPRAQGPRKDTKSSIDQAERRSPASSCNIFMFMPYLHFETDHRRREMQSALENPRILHRMEMTAQADEILIRAHLDQSGSFLHLRRTLDQFFYHNIDTHVRDSDQVVYRYQEKHRRESDEIKVFMVDQLWMWVLGKDLVITSFPQRWRQPRNDPLNVLEGIIEDINSKTRREPVQNVYELATIIAGRCFGTFDRHRKGDNDFQFLEMFENSIGAAMDNEATLFQEFSRASRLASEWLRSHQRPNRFSRNLEAEAQAHHHASKKAEQFQFDELSDHEPQFVDQLLDVGAETDLLAEIKDIRDELDIISMILGHQEHLLPELKEAIKSIYREERSLGQLRKVDKVFEEQEKTIVNPIKDIKRMNQQAYRIYESIRDLLDLKQKHAQAFETRFARDQAAGTQRQGQTIMVFTIVTVIFLPLSFIAAFFAINVSNFPHDPQTGNPSMSLGYVSQYVFGIGLAISIPCIAVALSVDELGFMVNEGKRRIRNKWRTLRRKRINNDEAFQLQTLKMEQAISIAKSMRPSMDLQPRSRPPRRSEGSPCEGVYGRRQQTTWDVERGRQNIPTT